MKFESEPLFFMHIGKTAGCYLKHCLSSAFGAGNVLGFCEQMIGPLYEDKHANLFDGKAVISGHVYLADWKEFCQKQGFETKLATVIRSPINLIVSAMRFFDSFNYPEKHAERNMLTKEIQELVLRLGKVDFQDAGSIDKFFTTLTPFSMIIFDNPQSRHFVSKVWGDIGNYIPASAPISLNMRPQIIDAFNQFSVVGLTERLPDTIQMLSGLAGRPIPALKSRINESVSPRTIDLGDEWIRRVLSKHIVVDDWLYRHAVHSFEQKIAAASHKFCFS